MCLLDGTVQATVAYGVVRAVILQHYACTKWTLNTRVLPRDIWSCYWLWLHIYFYFRSASRDALQCFVFRRSHFRISEHNCPAWSASGFVSVFPTKCLYRTPYWATTAFYTFWLMNYWPCDIWGARSSSSLLAGCISSLG
jgi:hypothetical protein